MDTDPNNQPNPNETASGFTLSHLALLLGLPETSTEAEIEGKLTELMKTALNGAAELTTAQTSLQTLQSEQDALKAQYDALWKKQEDLDKRQREAEADAALGIVKDKIPADKFSQLRDLFLTNPESAKLSLELFAAGGSVKTGEEPPPKPTHDPSNPSAGEETPAERVAKLDALIKQIQGEGKFKGYSEAREEARRRQPELFQ